MGYEAGVRMRGERGRFLRLTRWALDWDACKICGLTERPHHCQGVCSRCYNRTPEKKLYAKQYAERRKAASRGRGEMTDADFSSAHGDGWTDQAVPVGVDLAINAAIRWHSREDSRPDPVSLGYDALAIAIWAPEDWNGETEKPL